jgi:hypothetical protein
MSATEYLELCEEEGIAALEDRGRKLIAKGRVAEGLELLDIASHEYGVLISHTEPNCSPLAGGVYA